MINIIPEVSSNIAVLMKKRTDLITRLIGIVDSYGIHESGIHVKVADGFGSVIGSNQSRGIIERLASLRMSFAKIRQAY